MKRRYTILFFVSLVPLIGLSWLATSIGFSLWTMRSIGLIGMLLAAVIAAVAMARNVNTRWPAGTVAVVLLPNAPDMMHVLTSLSDFVRLLGVPSVIFALGWLATLVTAVAFALLPVPPPPREPQIAPARVVD